jgi:ketosteroid isomerase-like protein
MLDFFVNTEEFVFAGDGLLVVGFDKYAVRLRNVISNFTEVTGFEYKEPHVYVLSKDAASWSMEYEWSVTNKEGNSVNAKGSWMYIFKKFDDAWKVVHSAGTHLYE